MKKDELKRHYFEKGATALKRVAAIAQDCYCCPICKRLYLPKAIELGELTLEHAPPKKAGGKPVALTCKECNSIAGYSIDSAVVQRKKLHDAMNAITGQNQKYKGKATLSMSGIAVNINLETDESGVSFKPLEKINDPKKLTAYRNHMTYLQQTGKSDGQEFTITFKQKYHDKFSKIGDLKTAFIICFALFGYRFVLNKRLSPVREQTINYTKDIIDGYWLPPNPKIVQQRFICLTKKPITAIIVKLDSSMVILPWVKGPNNFYKHLKENYIKEGSVEFEGRLFSWPLTLGMKLDFLPNT